MLKDYPYRVLLFIKSDPDDVCETRRSLASVILDSPEGGLHILERKLKNIYGRDLEHAKQTGKLTEWLALALSEVAQHWHADTRENERAARSKHQLRFGANV